MKKEHQSPEFVVIKQDQANAKFFVASGMIVKTTGTSATTTQDGSDDTGNGTTNGQGGFDL